MRKWMLLVLLAIPLVGCSAPQEIQVAQVLQRQALVGYAENAQKVFATWDTVYTAERESNIGFTTEAAIARLASYAEDGKISVEDAQQAARAIAKHVTQANRETQDVRQKMQALQGINDAELVKALRLTDALTDFMNAGPGAEAIDELTTGLIKLLNERANNE